MTYFRPSPASPFTILNPSLLLVAMLAGCDGGRASSDSASVCAQYLSCVDAVASTGGAAATAYQ